MKVIFISCVRRGEERGAKSAEKAALGAGAIVMDVLAVNDGRLPHEKIELIRQLRPDMLLLAGGVVAIVVQAKGPRWRHAAISVGTSTPHDHNNDAVINSILNSMPTKRNIDQFFAAIFFQVFMREK